MQEEDFAKRLSALRQEKGASARDNTWELLRKNFLIMTMSHRIPPDNCWKH